MTIEDGTASCAHGFEESVKMDLLPKPSPDSLESSPDLMPFFTETEKKFF